ncbi:MBL fold metallo-hydrolase [Selenomonadales bacterium OttesenSCG-928-I06]|nr:MBL fold metallo-hydrolase [Selenomonadales bacterium OttesenSCG-928-I06]
MLNQVYPNIYCNQLPLPRTTLKWLNSYIIVSPDRNLIIDTGFNNEICREALFNGIKELNLDLSKTDVLMSHIHSDHAALADVLEEKGCTIYAGEKEKDLFEKMRDTSFWPNLNKLITLFGLDTNEITVQYSPGYINRLKSVPKVINPLKENDQLTYGEYVFNVIDLPGHSPGLVGLYEKKHQLCFCSDHILSTITPNITFRDFGHDSIKYFIESLQKVEKLPIKWLFTGHREILGDPKERIKELYVHHEERLKEVLKIMQTGEKTVAETASLMTWSITAKTWETFPKGQKWFACGEAGAHLEYLNNIGKLKRRVTDDVLYYSVR